MIFFRCTINSMAKEKIKRGRPFGKPGTKKEARFLLRLREDEKQAFSAAADEAGKSLAEWIRDRLRPICRRELEELNLPVAFVYSKDGRNL